MQKVCRLLALTPNNENNVNKTTQPFGVFYVWRPEDSGIDYNQM